MNENKQLCPNCKTGADALKLDPKEPMCPYTMDKKMLQKIIYPNTKIKIRVHYRCIMLMLSWIV